MKWLILCVNLAGSWCPDIWSDVIPDVPVKVFFLGGGSRGAVILTLKLMDFV